MIDKTLSLPSLVLHKLLPVNGTNLVATMGLKLLTELPDICVSREPVHLAVVTAIHLLESNGSLLLHFL